jgi:hypothetical protein
MRVDPDVRVDQNDIDVTIFAAKPKFAAKSIVFVRSWSPIRTKHCFRLYRALHRIGVHRAIYWGGMQPFGVRYNKSEYQLQPVVLPHVSHFMQVPLRTRVKLPHSLHISPS